MSDGSTVYSGEVVWFNVRLGYGFISWEDNGQKQKDMFVHYSDINSLGFRQLKADQKVTFSIGQNNHGSPKAVNVTVIE